MTHAKHLSWTPAPKMEGGESACASFPCGHEAGQEEAADMSPHGIYV